MDDVHSDNSINQSAIAIIGISGRFPGAKDLNTFWQNLCSGVESISFFDDQELESSGVDPAMFNNPNYVKAGAILEGVELFDAAFFGFNAREAEIIDPQQRLFLECAWEALESAGYNTETYQGAIGVYAGASMNTYLLFNILPNQKLWESVNIFQIGLANDKDFLPTRISYKLNLTGPSVNVQSACSTSLVAVHLACQSLLNGECDIALAGGVSVRVPQKIGYLYQEGGIASPDGHCRAFDAQAQGTIGGNGMGIVVLKRWEDALADRDCIHAIIKASAINNDGYLKVSYTAPSVDGQAAVISEAMTIAAVAPETITYIEAHGTGTALGDPIEIAALTQAFRTVTEDKGFCAMPALGVAIASLKTNIGHLDAASGIASLIKTVLALKHKCLPPNLHFQAPNPKIDFANSPFYVNTSLAEWKTNGSPRRAGVSSFGIGGTNAHIVLEEVQTPDIPSRHSRPWQLLLLSAKTSSALDTATANLGKYLKQHSDLNLADVAYTYQIGRRVFNHRRMLVCHNLEDGAIALLTLDPKRIFTSASESQGRPVVFMFSGQGAQYVNMGRELYQTEPTFQAVVDDCAEMLKPHLGLDLRHLLYRSQQMTPSELEQTAIAQPALFVTEYALAKLWQSWGVHPKAMIGYSIGEYVAATLAGVFSLEDALALVAARGQLMQQLLPGAMLAIPLPEKEVQLLLGKQLSLAAINGPSLCVVSGITSAVEALQKQLASQGVECRRLHTSHAFHSEMMEPILEPFMELVKKVSRKPPQIPYLSNVTGTWITATQATDPSYWAKHLRSKIRFAQGLQQLLKEPEQILLEVGPGRTLSTLARQHPENTAQQVILTSLRHPQDRESDVEFLLTTLGKLWLSGVKVDWSGFYAHEQPYRLPLPTYPFERQRYWIEPQKQLTALLHKKPDIADWFYLPIWKQSVPPGRVDYSPKSCWLVFVDECGLGSQIVKRLQQDGIDAIAVQVGSKFTRDGVYTLNPQQPHDYEALINELATQGRIPQTIVHFWSVTDNSQTASGLEWVDQAQDLGLHSLNFLAQALGKNFTDELQLIVVSNHIHAVTGVEDLCPEKATLLGSVKVIGQEYPNISCRSIDVVLPISTQGEQLIDQLLWELRAKSTDVVVAYRGLHRWVQTFEPVRLERGTARLREGGVYLITGGLGGIGFVLAEHLAKTVRAKLLLLGRSAFPDVHEWVEWLATHDQQDNITRQIRKIQELEKLGAEVLVLSADVANIQQMAEAIALAQNRFGEINGVIHTAGVADYAGVIHRRTKEMTDNVLAAKVKGTLVLNQLLNHIKLDFLILFSSLSSILYKTKFGQVGYSAANEFLDAFCYYKTSQDGTFTVSINWDDWQEVGMSVEAVKQAANKYGILANRYLQNGLLPKEGIDVFMRILENTFPRVAVSTEDLRTKIDLDLSLLAITTDASIKANLSQPTHPRPQLSNVYVAPRNEIEQTIAPIWQEFLGIQQVGVYDNFFELGGNSLLAIHILSKLHDVLQVKISLDNLFAANTIAELAEKVAQLQSQHTTVFSGTNVETIDQRIASPLVEIQLGSKQPFFCVHPIGGGVLCYVNLAQYLDQNQPFYGLQAAGLDGEQEPCSDIKIMATRYIQALQTLQPQGPYLLGGWSMGGVIAFEMATQLQSQGQKIALLALIDAIAPISSTEPTDIDDVTLLSRFVQDILGQSLEYPDFSVERLEQQSPEQRLAYLLEQEQIANLPIRHLFNVFKTNFRAMQSYLPPVYGERVTLFKASEQFAQDYQDQTMGWGQLTTKEVEIHVVPGNHYTIIGKPHVQVLAERLRVSLDQAQAIEKKQVNL
jgi:acyl transferase domain-containing protein/thioesterase domain-containing protein/acyl carrier protein